MIPVGIVGFRGYSGAELVHILTRHTGVEPVLLEHREAEQAPGPLGHPGPRRIKFGPEEAKSAGLKAVFLATPPEVSMDLSPALLDGRRLQGHRSERRLPPAHTGGLSALVQSRAHTTCLARRVRSTGCRSFAVPASRARRLIWNPGCYPTAANLAIRPLIEAGAVVRESGIVCDAKSGVSGAGRKASLTTSFCEVTENFSAYSILDHRHVPEVLNTSGLDEAEFSFTAQLLPLDRGILETIYFRAAEGIGAAEDLLAIYQKRYQGEPFVRLYAPGQVPDLRAVARTNYCDLGIKYDARTRRAVVVSAIDNLVKGAAGQAVQNLNLALGLPETAGLL